MSLVEQWKRELADKLSNKPYDDSEDNSSRRTVLGVTTCRGRQRWVNGTTGIAEISVRQEGSTFDDIRLIADIRLPFSGRYHAKNFIGVLCEYRDDPQSPSGVVTFTVTKTFLNTTMSNFRIESETNGGHDAGRMSIEGIQEDILQTL